ncbi:MAG: hypothetical protein ACTSYQ_02095, partial [Candidatus Odinarchaeia archaeon]
LRAYGGRGWIKRGELKTLSDEFIEAYLKTNSDVKKITVGEIEFLISFELLTNKLDVLTKDSLFTYFNKYLMDSELCEKISDQLYSLIK